MNDTKMGILYDFPKTIEQQIRIWSINKSKTLLRDDDSSLIGIYDTSTADENTLDDEKYDIIRTEIYNKNGVLLMSQYVFSLVGYPEFEEYDPVIKVLIQNEDTNEYCFYFKGKKSPEFNQEKHDAEIKTLRKKYGDILVASPVKVIETPSFQFRGFKVVAEQYEMHRDRETFYNHL